MTVTALWTNEKILLTRLSVSAVAVGAPLKESFSSWLWTVETLDYSSLNVTETHK